MTQLRNQPVSLTSDNYYSQHDQAVVERYKNMAAGQGLGDEIYYEDTDVAGIFQDLGLNTMNPAKE